MGEDTTTPTHFPPTTGDPLEQYLVWRADGGWFSTVGTGTTILADAQRFSRDDALSFCKNRSWQGDLRYIPVLLSDIEALS